MPVTQSYQNYYYNAKKLFEFRIKVANVDITNKAVMEAIKNALNAYEVESISAPKRLPIQEHRDFGKLGPCECEVIDIAVCYPVISEQVRQLVINRAGIPASNVCVYTKDQYLQEEGVEALIVSQGEGGPIIENPELKEVPGSQALVGQGRIQSLIKELEEHFVYLEKYLLRFADEAKTKIKETINEYKSETIFEIDQINVIDNFISTIENSNNNLYYLLLLVLL